MLMESISIAMRKIIEKCDVCIDGYEISRELLMSTFATFLASTIEKEQHNVNLVLHTGSICFDALILAFAAFSNILYNNMDPEEMLHSLRTGDLVLYKRKRYIFKGFISESDIETSLSEAIMHDDGDYVVLNQGEGWTAVHKYYWNDITPYLGKSKQLDGRGLRRDSGKRKDFLKQVLELRDADISNSIDASTVIVMYKEQADRLIQGLSFRYAGGEIKLTDLVTASYFTEGNLEYPYGKNAARVEPVLKVTSKMSVARNLILKKGGNRNLGLIVLGEDSIQRGKTELPELIGRRSIQYIYLCTHVDSDYNTTLLSNNEEANLFACTKEFLLSNSTDIVMLNPYTKQLSKQVDIIIDHEIDDIILKGFIDWEEYKKFKRALCIIKSSEYDSDEKDNFVIQAFSLMNLFHTAAFSIEELESNILAGKILNVEIPSKRIAYLELAIESFPEYLVSAAKDVIDCLASAYINTLDFTNKQIKLEELITQNGGKQVCIVVPKAYYSTMLKSKYQAYKNISIVTANKFDNGKIFDLIICVGNISGRRFDLFRCKSSRDTIVLLYENEAYQYHKKVRLAAKAEHFLNKRSTIIVEEDGMDDIQVDDEEAAIEEIEKIDDELIEFEGYSMARSARASVGDTNRGGMADIIAIAQFDSGEVAFFSKNYKAYILDLVGQTAREVKVEELAEDDTVVFTRSNAKTRDIVENLLQEMITKNRLEPEVIIAYKKSKKWKEILIEYMKKNNLSAKDIAKSMIVNGISVKEATIRHWLDEDEHTVGPRELSSLQQIGLLTNNSELFDNSEAYYDACAVIRRVRRKILDAIGTATLTEVTGQQLRKDSILATVKEQIANQAVVLQIDRIEFINDTVPVYLINRPVVREN